MTRDGYYAVRCPHCEGHRFVDGIVCGECEGDGRILIADPPEVNWRKLGGFIGAVLFGSALFWLFCFIRSL